MCFAWHLFFLLHPEKSRQFDAVSTNDNTLTESNGTHWSNTRKLTNGVDPTPQSVHRDSGKRVRDALWALHLGLSISVPLQSSLVVAQIPWPTDGGLLRITPARESSPNGATIRVQEVAQPGICNCLTIAVSDTLPLGARHTLSFKSARVFERSGALDVTFLLQLLRGAGTRGYLTQLRQPTHQGRCALM